MNESAPSKSCAMVQCTCSSVPTSASGSGLDITGLDHVINYDLPDRSAEEIRDVYIHRIGRTGRLHNGVATTFVDPRVDRNVIKPIIEDCTIS
ncbi:unnamed protein product [Heligmosomoides polygyrus]|uniref:ATP-dependent RNA helicase n=1 Tax=Heligmosomoides polygyrus TaxID=6339 RepID=A0A183FKN1_HELPZ|nr:unnamed protein product [Heligmosomoides polygyrus]